MTLTAFAIACGAPTKWVQNAVRLLGWNLEYSAAEARHLGLVRQLHQELGVSLQRAADFASSALADHGMDEIEVWAGDLTRVTVDVRRYRSDAAVRLAQALAHYEPRRRGRSGGQQGGAVARARAHGLDIGLLESALRCTAAERLRRLDESVEFIRSVRRGRRTRR